MDGELESSLEEDGGADSTTADSSGSSTGGQDSSSSESGNSSGTEGGTGAPPDEAGEAPETGLAETGTPAMEAATPESGSGGSGEEAGTPEASTPEAGADAEAGAFEAGADGGPGDAGSDASVDATVDATTDAEHAETGTDSGMDSTVTDAPTDSPTETGTEAGGGEAGGLAPCTTSGQANCVSCWGNDSGVCTPTEAILVQHDIDNGIAKTAGADPCPDMDNMCIGAMDGCYSCVMQGAAAIDDDVNGDSNNECGDLMGTFTGDGGGAGQTNQALCLATLQCIVQSNCSGSPDNNIGYCYCGAGGGTLSACSMAGSATNGVCKTQEANGFYYDANDSLDILKYLTEYDLATPNPSAKANEILELAHSNMCTSCYQ